MIPLTLKREEGKVLIKKGRKKFCSISYNKNTDYKFMIWFDGYALSGYETEEAAIKRAFQIYDEQIEMAKSLIELSKNNQSFFIN